MKHEKINFHKSDAYVILRLCYILTIVCALYILKINVFPESAYESMLALYRTEYLTDCVFYSTMILICGGVLLERVA